MGMLNSQNGYGTLTKALHWLIVIAFAFQFVGAAIMLRVDGEGTALGLSQATYYNWHKSIGLVALGLAIARLFNRKAGELPPWAPTLSALEQKLVHWLEQMLYGAMLVMPLSGFLFVMAGGYGVRLFGVLDLPNFIGEWRSLAAVARMVHIASGFALLLPLGLHLGLVVGHHVLARDGLLRRMSFRK